MKPVSLIIENASELVTVAGGPGPRRGREQGELGIVYDGAVAVGADGRIIAVGPTPEVRATVIATQETRVIDASDKTVLPGFVDPHTHAVFGGDRIDEFARRLAGADYMDILARGGGILNTVKATRAASLDELEEKSRSFFHEMLSHGTTTVEVKSGYGLNLIDELKMLRVAESLSMEGPITVVPTFLGAHAVPPEFQGKPEAYLDFLIERAIPWVAHEATAWFCDVFCERGVFTVEQSRRVLLAARDRDLGLKIHANQKSASGGARLAAELDVVSADHLEHITDPEIEALARVNTVAVLLPGATFMLMESVQPPARRLIEHGVPVALATDFNPGTSPILSMPLIIGLASVRRWLTPAEAIVASTINAAHAVKLGEEIGSLEQGKQADMVILDAPTHLHLIYWFGRNLVQTVIKGGKVVWQSNMISEGW
ncbi:MAG: imidazolonepropionase [Chloroflexota bacterium]|jgi:imidazolonepropionase